jgi:hypothetical protein
VMRCVQQTAACLERLVVLVREDDLHTEAVPLVHEAFDLARVVVDVDDEPIGSGGDESARDALENRYAADGQ